MSVSSEFTPNLKEQIASAMLHNILFKQMLGKEEEHTDNECTHEN